MTAGTLDVIAAIGSMRLVPVVVISAEASAVGVGQALKAGGLSGAEVTLRTPAALSALRAMSADPDLLLGAGTVVNVDQVGWAVAAGARYVVTPGFSATVVRECQTLGVPVIPGVATATEVQMALDAGVEVVKLFPAVAVGGVALIKALSAPFPTVRFVPTGGIGPDNLLDFLRLPAVLAVGGSWMVGADLVATGDFARIQELTAEAVALAGMS